MKESDLKRLYLFEHIYNRYKNDMTQKEVAERIGVSERTIQNWLSQNNRITQKNIEGILNAFNIEVNIFDESILNKVVEGNRVFPHVISKILSDDDFDISLVSKKSFNDDIKYLLNDTLKKVSENENYNIPYGAIKEDTLRNIYYFIVNELKADYKAYAKNDDEIEKNNQIYYFDLLKSKANLIIYKTLLKGFEKEEIELYKNKLQTKAFYSSDETGVFADRILDIVYEDNDFLELLSEMINITMKINFISYEQAHETIKKYIFKVIIEEIQNIFDLKCTD